MSKVLSGIGGSRNLAPRFPVSGVLYIQNSSIRPLLRGYSCQNTFGVAFLASLVPGVEVV